MNLRIPIMYVVRIVTLAFCTLFFAVIISEQASAQRPPRLNYRYLFLPEETYDDLWKRVDGYLEKQLPKSALEVVDQIYAKAIAEGNQPQRIKALVYRVALHAQTSDSGDMILYTELRDEMQGATGVPRAILSSMLGELLWSYYQGNRWKIMGRTATDGGAPEDFRTWDPQRYFDSTQAFYLASLEPSAALQATPVRSYKEMLTVQKGSELVRPTMYDLLAFRALGFLANDETGLPKPIREFELDDARGLAPAQTFVATTFATPDSSSQQWQSLLLFQRLLRSHLDDRDPAALVDADLARLKYAHDVTLAEEKDSIYIDALTHLARQYKGNDLSANISFRLAEFYQSKGKYIEAMKVCDEVIRDYPSSDGATNCRAISEEIRSRSFTLTSERTTLPNAPFIATVSYRNVESLYFRVVALDEKVLSGENEYATNYFDEKSLTRLLAARPLQSFIVTLPKSNPEDYLQHTTAIKVAGLGNGRYVILASPDKSFPLTNNAIAYSTIDATRFGVVSQSMANGSTRVRISDAVSGHPLGGVTAEVWTMRYNSRQSRYDKITIQTSTTDETGFISINARRGDFYQVGLTLDRGDDHLLIPGSIPLGYPEEAKSSTRTMIYTDRSIYRPGQTIYFKGISFQEDYWKANYEVMPKRSVTIVFYDANHQKIADQSFTTNEFGSFHGSFQAPTGLLTGSMRLATNDGTREIRVEEHKRPRFETKFEPLTGILHLNENITVKGTATAYAGSVIDGASVSYRVVRDVRWPYWRGWWYPPMQSGPKEIAHGTVTTNASGAYEISFMAQPDKSIARRDLPVFSYTITADVTDINGETRSATTTVSAGYTTTVLSLTSGSEVETGHEGMLRLRANNLNGQPIASAGKITVAKLSPPWRRTRARTMAPPDLFALSSAEFIAAFPLDPYDADSSNRDLWRTEQVVMDRPFRTDTAGVDSANFPRLAPGVYRVVAETVERSGDTVRTAQTMTVFDKSSTRPLSPEPLSVIAVKKSGEPGERAELLVGSGYSDGSLLLQVDHKGKMIREETIALANAQQLITVPLLEEYRGGITIHLTLTHDYRVYTESIYITVPWSNKDLSIETSTFRDKLKPGQQEEWRLTIKGSKSDRVAAEMVATLYDASLDAIFPNGWPGFSWPTYWSRSRMSDVAFGVSGGSNWERDWNSRHGRTYQAYDQLNMWGLRYGGYYRGGVRGGRTMDEGDALDAAPTTALRKESVAVQSSGHGAEYGEVGAPPPPPPPGGAPENRRDNKPLDLPSVQIRTNLNETAFFMPDLQTNDKGEVVLKFTIPEALTRWRLMGFAHTTDMKVGSIDKSVVTQKELMIIPNLPRFFREGDSIAFAAKVSNLSGGNMSGGVKLTILDAISLKPMDSAYGLTAPEQSFSAEKGRSASVEWKLRVPMAPGLVLYRITASAGNFSDGEEGPIPVLPNRMLVTETLPLNIRGNESRNYTMPKLVASATSSSTLRNQKLTLEMTSNPAWYAVQALPYLIEFPYECAEQTFSRLYANAIASHIANSNPRIKRVFDSWKGTDALVSNLEKNQELKGLLLEETPWVMQGKDETERKQRIALLFDLNRMSGELASAMRKLDAMQDGNGGWPWFEGMRPDAYITQYIVAGIGHLRELAVDAGSSTEMTAMAEKALGYIDNEMNRRYNEMKSMRGFDPNADNIGAMEFNYLYARSFFTKKDVSSDNKEAFNYWKKQAQKYWTTKGLMAQGMIALALKRFDDAKTPMAIIASLRERSLHSDELGTYWKFEEGWWWYQAPVETQAILIEAFDVVIGDQKEIDEMKIWLLKQKQVQDWKTTKATAEACYALLRRGSDFLSSDKIVDVTIGGQRVDPTSGGTATAEAGTGYFKTSWSASEITPSMGNITVTKRDAGIAWGALYWQYFEQLDKITPHASPLSISKGMFLQKNTDRGKVLEALGSGVELHVGDIVVVRVEVRSDRDMEYIHVKDMRGAGLEPTQQLSGYRWQGGLGYYQAIKDASTNFFIGWLPKGVWVFEYPLRVSHKGRFSNGISTVQSMYAPEFAGHSAGEIVAVR
jgi:hypothetical protein